MNHGGSVKGRADPALSREGEGGDTQRRDWHATYLTDPRVMNAARQRAVEYGEDGWSAAYTLALTTPPAFSSHDAADARAVIAPQADLDSEELAQLDHTARSGYYVEPGIGEGNSDMAPSMVRRVRPGEMVRPDLRCPPCCEQAGDPEESGMPQQVYRCPQCQELWEYRPLRSHRMPGFDQALLRVMQRTWFSIDETLDGSMIETFRSELLAAWEELGSCRGSAEVAVNDLREVLEFAARDPLPLDVEVSLAGMQVARQCEFVVEDYSLDHASSVDQMVVRRVRLTERGWVELRRLRAAR